MNKLGFVLSLLLSAFSITVSGAELTIPNQFSAGSAAVAAEVNANFSAVETAVDDNAVNIAALMARIEVLEADNAAMQNFITEVLPHIEGGVDAQGQATVFFTGANVHVNNGEGATDTVNGLGNLIVGYDETFSEARFPEGSPNFCTEIFYNAFQAGGTAYDNQADCEANGGVWGDTSQKIGSHNFIVGTGHSYTQYGGLITGEGNTAAGAYSSVSGGALNLAGGAYSGVSGGSLGNASGSRSAVSGGYLNTANGGLSSVSGGRENTASGPTSSVSGGNSNNASQSNSSVSGGDDNNASGISSSISGGNLNIASGFRSAVSGGRENTASGFYSTVSGGRSGAPDGEDDWVAGNLFEDD